MLKAIEQGLDNRLSLKLILSRRIVEGHSDNAASAPIFCIQEYEEGIHLF